jgi:NAD(P)-dependent dehydrogenase (short-subunit alcohol dehydrogenase family)
MSVSTRVVLITGGSSGIGAACVRRFLAEGWRVSVLALDDSNLDRLRGLDVLTIPGDMTSERVREAAVARTVEESGGIDALVNSAGVGLYAEPSETPLAMFSRLLEVNVLAPLALAQMVIPLMRKRGGGVIVNVGSVAGDVALPWAAAYSASKSALRSIHDSLRRELRGDSIRLVEVCPGITDTDFRRNVLAGSPPPGVKRIRWIVPADAVAAAVVRAAEHGRGRVYIPWIGAVFALMGAVAPWLMDIYLSRFRAARPDTVTPEEETASEPAFDRSESWR